jgi:hypothetical protein
MTARTAVQNSKQTDNDKRYYQLISEVSCVHIAYIRCRVIMSLLFFLMCSSLMQGTF